MADAKPELGESKFLQYLVGSRGGIFEWRFCISATLWYMSTIQWHRRTNLCKSAYPLCNDRNEHKMQGDKRSTGHTPEFRGCYPSGLSGLGLHCHLLWSFFLVLLGLLGGFFLRRDHLERLLNSWLDQRPRQELENVCSTLLAAGLA